jgi:hypothetical protein
MARNDLILSLVRAAATGDQSMIRSTVDAMVADEKAKKHSPFADRLKRALESNGIARATPPVSPNGPSYSAGAPPNGKEYLLEINPKQTLAGLILPFQARQIIERVIEEQNRGELLRSHGLQPRHRLLFSGPPGNGKTSLAEAIADALNLPFFSVRYDMLIGSYLGETTQRLRRLFDYARITPCVLFFDEFDVVGKERGDPHETGEIKRVVSTLLLQIDALPSYVVVIAATNHGELLDRAVWRRFEVRLNLPKPSVRDLALYFDHALKLRELTRNLKISGLAIARRLGSISYSEASDFWLDISRRQILAMDTVGFKDILNEQLDFWSERVGASQNAGRSKQTSFATLNRTRSRKNRSRKQT